MENSQDTLPGFAPEIQEQLRQASMSMRGRGQDGRGRNNSYPHGQAQSRQQAWGYSSAPPRGLPPNTQLWDQQVMDNPNDLNSFPPIGAKHSQTPQRTLQQYQPARSSQPMTSQFHQSPQHAIPDAYQSSQGQRRDFHPRGRGSSFRGRGIHTAHHNQHQYPQNPSGAMNVDAFDRPAPVQRKLHTPGIYPHFSNMEEQRAFQRMIMDQSDFLNHLASQSLKNQLTTEEQQAKECFRKELEAIAQKVVASAQTDGIKVNPEHVHLKLYGSLGSGFAVAGSDMDLLLAFPQTEGPLGDIEIESRRMLEKALLDAGIGARLLTNTRVPILRVCEKPSSELLKNLREHRAKWEESLKDDPPVDEGFGAPPPLTDLQVTAAAEDLAALALDAHEIPLPSSPILEHANLEYVGDCGIQCDINFSNHVALHNTRLLKTYGHCDPRVRQVGVFVKNWAKTKDINTPYRGTLSSYGYILMVLHYLMNVVHPPILPNLQVIAKSKDSWENKAKIDLVEGFDVRFVQDMNEVQAIMRDMPRNHESVGALLRGFFWYYADARGFHWNHDVISIRSHSGRLLKKTKGWTEAKWSSTNSSVRLRYLLAIEDPFELEHNVARTVGHSGVVAIRDEFRRAWSIIEKIKYDTDLRMWYWLSDDDQKISGHEMIAAAENKGDLLRKDQNYRREKMRKMKTDLEAKEKALQDAVVQEAESTEDMETNGTFKEIFSPPAQGSEPFTTPSMALIKDGVSQVEKRQQKWSRRRVVSEGEDEQQEEPTIAIKEIDWGRPFDGNEIKINEEWADGYVDQGAIMENIVEQAAPVWADGEDSVDRSALESPSEEHLDIVIEWSRRSLGGRWLHWRDNQVRAGTWRGTRSPMFQRLDEAFPYDENMTVAEQTRKNKILTKLYMYSYRPRNLTSEAQDQSSKTSIDHSDRPATTDNKSSSKSTWEMPYSSDSRSEHNQKRNDITLDSSIKDKKHQAAPKLAMEDAEQSTAQNASALSRASSKSARSSRNRSRQAKRKNAKKQADISTTETTTQPDLISILTPTTDPQTSNPESTRPQLSQTSQDLLSLFTTNPPPQPRSLNPDPTSTTVPPTLYPDHPPHQRPRDEDPNIIPIPRFQGYTFDPRHLADLETIRLGGNGCARAGEEFDIEDDFEFGGWRVLTEDPEPKGEDNSVAEETTWEPRGDAEGLLGELPAGGWEDRSGV